MTKNFLRKAWKRYSKLGKRRKNKQKWRRARGRHSKIRKCKMGNLKKVKIGYKKSQEKKVSVIHNIKELEKTTSKKIIIAKIGNKKKKEILKRAEKLGVGIINPKIKEKREKQEVKIKNKDKQEKK